MAAWGAKEARKSGCEGGGMKDVVLSLYDLTGNMTRPWIEAGYTAVLVDMQHKPGIEHDGNVIRIGADIRNGWMPPRDIVDRIAFVSAFPPCDHLAVSGARWFKGKGLRKLALSVDLFATAAELCEWVGAPYMIENPVSTISSYWRKPDAMFHPHHFTLLEPDDNYTKATCLWVGGGSSCLTLAGISRSGRLTTESTRPRRDRTVRTIEAQHRWGSHAPCSGPMENR